MTIEFRVSAAGLCILCVACAGGARAQQGAAVALPEIVISTTPLPTGGTGGISVDKVPADVTTISAKDYAQKYSPSVADAITARVPAALAINVDGSDFSPDLFYRGFDASRISGTAQGLAVYENGVRINEVFGDSVNLELIPPVAIAHTDVYTNNPIFGLNALGGAVNFTMKNGFTYQGGEASILGGSYGRVNGTFQYGKQVGDYSFYVAADGLRDGGFRAFSASNLERAYADLGYRTQDSEFHLIGGYGRSDFGALASTPEVLVNQQYNSVFTNPQTTNNQSGLVQLTGRVDATPHWSIASNVYIRQFDQFHVDGNDSNFGECVAQGAAPRFAGDLCSQGGGAGTDPNGIVLRNNGKPIPFLGNNFPYGTTTDTSTHSTSYGLALQATNKDRFFDHDNYFVVGGSIDVGNSHFNATTTIGVLNAQLQNVTSGINLPGIGDIAQTQGRLGYSSVYVASTTTYYGLFALDTFNITKDIALTGGARFNLAKIGLADQTGLDANLNTNNTFQRINPVVGLTYNVVPALTLYGGYSEANRAPVPLESACSDPMRPCTLESALVSDPPLQQVVSHTIEAGGRGAIPLPNEYGALTYKAGYFHTTSTNDILTEASAFSGQGFFANVPETLRQGVEAGVGYDHGPWSFYGNYAYVDATYQFSGPVSSPNNPSADANGNVMVHPGDHIPGIPRHLGKLGAEYHITPRFVVGADTILVGSQYFVGDENNQQPQLPFYYVVNAHASYQVTDHVQIFGFINNLLNRQYATYGTFYGTGTTAGLVNTTLAANAASALPDARTITVAQPLSVYGGVKITF